jgi:hypothetical protein
VYALRGSEEKVNAKEIKEVMALIRPAIFAMYGQQRLKMTGYRDVFFTSIYIGSPAVAQGRWSGWFEVTSQQTDGSYIVELNNGETTTVGIGILKLQSW